MRTRSDGPPLLTQSSLSNRLRTSSFLRQSEPVGSAVITGGGRENQGLGGQAGLAELLTEYLDGGGRVLGQVIDFNGGVFVGRGAGHQVEVLVVAPRRTRRR